MPHVAFHLHNEGNLTSELNKGAIISQIGGKKREFKFPYAPKDMSLERHALKYNEIERPGRRPLLEAKQVQLRQVSFQTYLANRSGPGEVSVEDQIKVLSAMAREDTDLRFSYDANVNALTWRISDIEFGVTRRDAQNKPTITTVKITMTEVVRLTNALVPGMARIVIAFAGATTGGSKTKTNDPPPVTIPGSKYTEDIEPSKVVD